VHKTERKMEAGLRERRNPKEWETKTSFEEVTA
jgi:hypothetical protein